MGRQPKSSSHSKRTRKKASTITREVPVDESTAEALQHQREAFFEKLGRQPEGDDPVFFDPYLDEPTPFQKEEMNRQMIQRLEQAGTPPQLVRAYRRSGRLVSQLNLYLLSAEDLDEWNAATLENFE